MTRCRATACREGIDSSRLFCARCWDQVPGGLQRVLAEAHRGSDVMAEAIAKAVRGLEVRTHDLRVMPAVERPTRPPPEGMLVWGIE